MLRRARMIKGEWNATTVVVEAVTQWLDDLESKEIQLETWDGYPITKPAGRPFPERRTDQVRQGPPPKNKQRTVDLAPTTIRFPVPLAERMMNAVWWRQSFRSHDVEDAVRAWFRENLPSHMQLR